MDSLPFENSFCGDIYTKWYQLVECKKRFLDEGENPVNSPYVSREVAESWIISRNNGIDPYARGNALGKKLSTQQFQHILQQNLLLIGAAKSAVSRVNALKIFSGFILYLFDKNGVVLLQGKEWEGSSARSSSQNIAGRVLDEHITGTNAHVLSFQLKKPVQLLGPEHYSMNFLNHIAFAAPIFGNNEDIIGALALVSQPLNNLPDMQNFDKFCSHSLGLVTMIAEAIELHLNLAQDNNHIKTLGKELELSNNRLTNAYDMLEAAVFFADEAVITIDNAGNIKKINREGARLLKLKPHEILKVNINDFFNNRTSLMAWAAAGKITEVEETVCTGNTKQTCMITVSPTLNSETQKLAGAVLKLKPLDKITVTTAKKAGTAAVYHFEKMIGQNHNFKKAIKLGLQFANSSENVLLIGESGTGKELFAQSIHNAYRPQGPFMAVNCAAMPRELIESELFGYEGGSFTGANHNGKPGKIELAHGGTLFLDEVGDMPIDLQAILLRTLEDKQVMRIGGQNYKDIDFRLIAATNKDLKSMVKENLFREDLYFRLSVLPINIPPLRRRKDDIDLFCQYFTKDYCDKHNRSLLQIDPTVQKMLNDYHWPGNIRELKNVITYAINTTTTGGVIEPENLPDYIVSEINPAEFEELRSKEVISLKNWEIAAIKLALSRANNHISSAADLLGIGKSTLYRKLNEYNIIIK